MSSSLSLVTREGPSAPDTPYLAETVTTNTGVGRRYHRLGPLQSIMVKDGDDWLYHVGNNKDATLATAWKTYDKYRTDTNSCEYTGPTRKKKESSKAPETAATSENKFRAETWPLPKGSQFFLFPVKGQPPVELCPPFVVITDQNRTASSQTATWTGRKMDKHPPITHVSSVASEMAGVDRFTELEFERAEDPSIVVTDYDDDEER